MELFENGNIKFTYDFTESDDNSILCVDESKLRLLDPLVKIDDQLKHLSDIDDNVKFEKENVYWTITKK